MIVCVYSQSTTNTTTVTTQNTSISWNTTRVLLGKVTQVQSNMIFVGWVSMMCHLELFHSTCMTAQTQTFLLPWGNINTLRGKTSAAWLSESFWAFFWRGAGIPLSLNLALCVDFTQAAVAAASKQSRGGYEESDTKGGKRERMPRSTEAFSENKK